eukprot:CAMPEP_0202959550 /NCGR_PEP_ID=MMETSP1396-20130829/3723_1 /ASSEMBLY_ACC=CAM_ASM_000872 /TAXON_ID= /ORGANISM="Pseudokeronopsis sp., Strain Brazil" /LENGTH=109 /DNA_ID=CAMNT_0049678151 /DNA_START=710 /DNA_END=1039 /DNA_ORIENTATION=-
MANTICYTEPWLSSGKTDMLTLDAAFERVQQEHITTIFSPKVKDLTPGAKFEMYCFDEGAFSQKPKYTLIVMDSEEEDAIKKNTCGVFVPPLGEAGILETEEEKKALVK